MVLHCLGLGHAASQDLLLLCLRLLLPSLSS